MATIRVMVRTRRQGKSLPYYRASCDDAFCIGHLGVGIEYPNQRGAWIGNYWRQPKRARDEAEHHAALYHPTVVVEEIDQ